jgi:ABC-type spermidine/putrescine transport system permease subunit II
MFADIRFEISPQIAAVGMLLLTATIVLLLLVRFANRRRGEEIPLGIAPPA